MLRVAGWRRTRRIPAPHRAVVSFAGIDPGPAMREDEAASASFGPGGQRGAQPRLPATPRAWTRLMP